jgi:hypothetical protein
MGGHSRHQAVLPAGLCDVRFLADVRNCSAIPPIAECRGIIPPGPFSELPDHMDLASCCSWLTVNELTEFDYDAAVEDRRVDVTVGSVTDCGRNCEPGGGEMTTYGALLGPLFFDDLQKLQALGAESVVLGFSL